MGKAGRPKQDQTKDHKVTVRMSDETYARLLEYADKQDTTMTEIVVKALEEHLSKNE